MRLIVAVAIIASLIWSSTFAQSPDHEELQFLVIEALSRNPALSAELSKMEAAQARVLQAGSLHEPELRFTLREMPGFMLRDAMASSVELLQTVRFPTKLMLQSDIAAVQAEHAHHEHLEKVIEVVHDLKTAHAELWFARRALAINREDQALLGSMVAAAETQYSVGRVSQSDVLKLRVELAKARAEEAVFHQQVSSAESALRALLNRKHSMPIGHVELDSLIRPLPPVEAIVRYALSNRPMLVHDSLQVLETSLMAGLARQEFIPDLTVSIEYMSMDQFPLSRWTVSAGITLPFIPWTFGKSSSRVQEAEAEVMRSSATHRAAKNMVESGIRDAYAKYQASFALVGAYEASLVPQTSASVHATVAEYRTGRTSYLMLIDSYRLYQTTRLESLAARSNLEKATADLAYRAGVIDLSIIPERSTEESQ